MTPDMQSARAGYRRPQVRRADGGTTVRSGGRVAEAARTGQLPPGRTLPPGNPPMSLGNPPVSARADLIAKPATISGPHERAAIAGEAAVAGEEAGLSAGGRRSRTFTRPRMVERAARRAREETSIAKVIPLLAVLVVTVAGIYIAWLKGSAGGGEGGVVGGAALLAAAVARLVLPTQVVGLLATRKRALDVTTLAVFGACLLVMGLVLPS